MNLYNLLSVASKDTHRAYILYTSAASQESQAASVPLAIFQELLMNHDTFNNFNQTAEDEVDIPRLLVHVYFNIGLHNININPSKLYLSRYKSWPYQTHPTFCWWVIWCFWSLALDLVSTTQAVSAAQVLLPFSPPHLISKFWLVRLLV